MVVEVARSSAELHLRLAVCVAPGFPKTFICRLIVVCEIKAVLDEGRASIRIVADPIAPNPWIQ